MRKFSMTCAQAEEHQRKHGFIPVRGPVITQKLIDAAKRKSRRMNKTEREFSVILEAQKRKGEIQRYEFEGMRLAWGRDPKTGNVMWYTPDFVVFWELGEVARMPRISMIETKGAHIHYRQQAMARFKGARSDWPEFQFEMWQRDREGRWTRLH